MGNAESRDPKYLRIVAEVHADLQARAGARKAAEALEAEAIESAVVLLRKHGYTVIYPRPKLWYDDALSDLLDRYRRGKKSMAEFAFDLNLSRKYVARLILKAKRRETFSR